MSKNKKDSSALKRYAIYIRVSSDRQANEGDSIEMQEDLGNEIITEHSGVLYKVYADPAISASKTDLEDRPALIELLMDAKQKKFDCVIAFKRDRLARKPEDMAYIRRELKKCNVELVYSAKGEMHSQDDDAMGNYIEGIFALNAQFESAIISQRTAAVLRNKVKKGERVGGVPPYGYILAEEKVVLVPKEIEIVKEIEQLYIQGLGEYAIARWLNGKEIKGKGKRPLGAVLTIDRRTGEMKPFSKDRVRYILTNPFYCGKLLYNKRDSYNRKRDESEWIIGNAEHEACRTDELHEQLQQIRKDKEDKRKPPRFYNTDFLLTGFIYCKCCGRKWASRKATKKGKEYFWYTCGSTRGIESDTCKAKWIAKDLLEEFVINEVKKYASSVDIDDLQNRINTGSNINNENISKRLKEIESELKQLEVRRKRNLQLQEDAIDEEELNEYKERQREIRDEIKELKEQKEMLENTIKQGSESFKVAQTLYNNLNEFMNAFDSAPTHLKKKLLEEVLYQINIGLDGVVDIQFKLDIPTSKVAGYDAQQHIRKPKNTTIETLKNLDINGSIEDWMDYIYTYAKENIRSYIIQQGEKLLGGKFSASKLQQMTSVPKYVFDNSVYNGRIPREQSLQMIAEGFNTTVEQILIDIGLDVTPEILFDIIGSRKTVA